ncbi:hypothetical protein HZY97_09235 [Sphingomonas sp. R-74633]|uniref:hypothetical protein n=1 Tax=Sphingomonas sp. R-74633 TaxID=2751188 RepID=UPI0015D1E2DA|nr:hypothetical protein [Sphingomonas sp. R-74633]NYT40936.1 hypothetical protein [Sphingomonas sp. R-74633]
MHHQPIQPEAPADPLADYIPVTLSPRHDGWTAERQRIFLTALAETGCISDACKAAGVTARSAYRLRHRADADAFARAWDDALLASVSRLAALAFERATYGSTRELWKNGALVAESREPSDKLLMFLLQHLRSEWFRPKKATSNSPSRGAWGRFNALLDELADNGEPADPLLARHYEPEPPQTLPDPLGEADEEW